MDSQWDVALASLTRIVHSQEENKNLVHLIRDVFANYSSVFLFVYLTYVSKSAFLKETTNTSQCETVVVIDNTISLEFEVLQVIFLAHLR